MRRAASFSFFFFFWFHKVARPFLSFSTSEVVRAGGFFSFLYFRLLSGAAAPFFFFFLYFCDCDTDLSFLAFMVVRAFLFSFFLPQMAALDPYVTHMWWSAITSP